jgi:hypothetical protein
MANITKVPNGPLIKKKGPFKGSTLKSGGTVKKAQTGNKIVKGSRPGLGVFRTIKERTTSGGVAEPYKYKTESIDTTGFSKGRNKYEVKTVEGEGDKTGSKVTSTKSKTISRKNVPSTLKSLKKAQDGNTLSPYMQKRAAQQLVKEKNIRARDSILNRNAAAKGMTREQVQAQQVADKNKPDAPTCDTNDPNFKSTKCGISKAAAKESKSDFKKKKNGGPVVKKAKAGAMIKRAQTGESLTKDDKSYTYTKQVNRPEGKRSYQGKSTDQTTAMKIANFKSRNTPSDSLRTVKPVIKKNGGLIKRADGSMSRRGLWDNIRANKGSGKKPTAAMLKQEKKIKAKTKK